jgi:hypothetical protein
MPIYAEFYPRFAGGVTVAGTGVRSQLEAIAFPGSVPAASKPAYLPSRFIVVEMQLHAVPPALRQHSSQGVHGHEGVRWDFTKNSDFTLAQPHAVSPALRQHSPQGVHRREGVRWDFTKNSDFTVNISWPKNPAGVTVRGVVVERDLGNVRLSPGTYPVERFVLSYLRMTRAGMPPTTPDVTEAILTEFGPKAQRLAPSTKASAGGRTPAHGGMMILLQDGSTRWS